jgi:hypothetical protein
MVSCSALDSVLADLARSSGRHTDLLLDFRCWAVRRQRAGACVKAYFDLFEEAPTGAARGLSSLRRWLESRLEIAVLESRSQSCLEVFRLELAGEDSLEAFCHKAMDRLRADRCHCSPEVTLTFRFRENLAQAA